ncbi:alcohol dehydrogenase catalytic domain-containing protein [Nonomuraea rhodomycinica]|uniref:alcohol dehydrogenase catalytic domain-containing protein n=1 Tax=Nonomuraea rhodomycinica TaxID=1712872 RepID=UPI001C3760B0
MRAFQLVEWQEPPELREVPVPEPGPGQVLVKIGGAGACHSDLHIMQAPAPPVAARLPCTLGHENAGWVEAPGPGVTGSAPGPGGTIPDPAKRPRSPRGRAAQRRWADQPPRRQAVAAPAGARARPRS